MSSAIRRLRRGKKNACKFAFKVNLQELLLCMEQNAPPPTKVLVTFQHRNRKITTKERDWEPSFNKPEQSVLVWPEQFSEPVVIATTLYKGQNDDHFDDKEWTVVIEDASEKRKKAIAAVSLNMRLFVSDLDHRSQLKLKLRPLIPSLRMGTIVFLLGCECLPDNRKISLDVGSNASTLSMAGSREISVENVDEVVPKPIDPAVAREINKVTASIDTYTTERKDERVHEKPTPFTPSPALVPSRAEPPKPSPHKPDERILSTPSEGKPAQIRPHWRVSTEEQTDSAPKRRPDVIAVEAVFEVNAKSQPFPSALPPHLTPGQAASPRLMRSHSPRAPSRDRAPETKEGEKLLGWAQRVTEGYDGVKINEFTKSWRNGMALCAVLHAYRPDLLDYSTLDISETMNGRKSNIKKALSTCSALGITDIPDVNDILTPDSKIIQHLLNKVKRVLEGTSDLPTPVSINDNWEHNLIPVTTSEQQVIDEINRIKELREAEEAVDYSNIEDTSRPEISRLHEEGSDFTLFETPRNSRARSSSRNTDYQKRARQLLANPITPSSVVSTPDPETERRRIEAKRLIEAAVTDGATIQITSTNASRTPTTWDRQQPGRSSLTGSYTDLRKVELVRPSVTMQTFRKRDPSPVLQRKEYQNSTPILPAISRGTQQVGEQLMQRVGVPSWSGVKRFGSMRGQELRDSISQIASYYGVVDPVRGSQQSISGSVSNTLTRKEKGSQWEKDVEDIEGCSQEQAKIVERLADIAQQSGAIQWKINEADKGSEEEESLVNTYIELTNEKNSLVAKQDYYNIIEKIRIVLAEINGLNKKLGEITKSTSDSDTFFKSAEEKAETDRVMNEYMAAIERKDRFIQQLFETENQQIEDEERLKSMTLERASNFIRGNEEPVSASKRIMTWIRGS